MQVTHTYVNIELCMKNAKYGSKWNKVICMLKHTYTKNNL